jgi:hypothetical protein
MNSRTSEGSDSINFASDFRITMAPIEAALAVVGTVVIYLANAPREGVARLIVLVLGFLLLGLVPTTLWLDGRRPLLSRCVAILALTASVHMMSLWLGIQTALAFAPVMVVLAAASVNLWFSAAVALVETLALVALAYASGEEVSPTTLAIGAGSVWATVLAMIAVYQPVRHVGQWVQGSQNMSRY